MSTVTRPARPAARSNMEETIASPENNGTLVETEEDQTKFRLMEISHRHINEDSQSMLRMQRQQIDKLKRDNDRLKEELALETRQAKQVNNLSTSAQIAKLQDQSELYLRKISKEKEKIKTLNEQIEAINVKLLDQRKVMGGVNAFKQNNQAVQKKIRLLENRLDKALVKFNEALAYNTQLRSQIENLRRERSVFDEIYKKLERELQEKKSKMEEIIAATQDAHDLRDQAQQEMLLLKRQADKDQESFEQEWALLKQSIEQDRLTGPREDSGNNMALTTTTTSSLANARGSEQQAAQEARELRERVRKGEENIQECLNQINTAMERVQSYEEAFAKIQKATRITDIDELVNTFITAEDVSFSIFNHLNDLAGEIEQLEDSIHKTEKELESLQRAQDDSQRKTMLTSLEDQLKVTDEEAATHEAQFEQCSATMQRMRDGVQSLYHKLGCAAIVAPELMGSTGVTEHNLMQYLAIIEQRASELIATYRRQQDRLLDGGDNGAVIDYNADAVVPRASDGYMDVYGDESGIDANLMAQAQQRLGY